MDPFEKAYWSRLQVELWVCTRRREAVALANHAPGRTRFADLSLGPDGIDDEKYDVDVPPFVDEDELILWAISRYGYVCPFDEARKAILDMFSKGKLRRHQDPSSGLSCDEFFEREEVLALWQAPVCAPRARAKSDRYAKVEPLTFSGAVLLLTRGLPSRREPQKEAVRRWYRRFGTSSPDIKQKFISAGQQVINLIESRRVEAWGTPCDADGNVRDEEDIQPRFLKNGIIADALADVEIRMDRMAPGGFGRQDRGYTDIRLDRAQFLEAIRSQQTSTATIPLTERCAITEKPRPLSPSQLDKFLNEHADGINTEAECNAAAQEHFCKPIPRKLWRDAWGKLPGDKKRARGQKRLRSHGSLSEPPAAR